MIAITGANGQLGQLVINSLLQKTAAADIVALVRNPDNAQALKDLGVEVRKADYNQPDTLTSALAGVHKLLLISGSEVGQRVPQHTAVIEAAKAAGVELFAYTSILKADTNPMVLAQEHKVTEELIQQSGLPAVILRNGWYSENYTQSLPVVLETGAVADAASDGRFSTASRKDYAEAAAVVLTSSENHAGKTYELAGDQSFTLSDYAAEISRQSGKHIQYSNMAQQDFAELLVQVGLPEGFAAALADSGVQASKGWLEDNSGTLGRLIDRPTETLAEAVAAAL
ncbi:SDR family oxidoreductase [Bacterioplanoides sp. SCSIO 12839]|uniref:SDR family oxidoreductase n=1 Tax=Bacterioplanoides sp. SCSIO 12839 TaxID=2829569 RepID=UPI00210395F6|nr:SDR family oxidoreductase [Bacterioplanoides sp. SCSIO 12839]UTW47936.1 SDR family oxidoreductase [Bacterioplanoides sp. SCSIO 12839]